MGIAVRREAKTMNRRPRTPRPEWAAFTIWPRANPFVHGVKLAAQSNFRVPSNELNTKSFLTRFILMRFRALNWEC